MMSAKLMDRQVLLNYIKNRPLRYLSIILLLGTVCARSVPRFDISTIGRADGNLLFEILYMMLFVFLPMMAAIFWPSNMGIILKTQFAHPRAGILPNFRRAHIQTALLLYAAYLALVFFNRTNFTGLFEADIPAWEFMATVSFFSALAITLSYFFHYLFWSWMWAFYFLFMAGGDALKKVPHDVYLTVAAFLVPVLLGVLIWRLKTLKEGMWEYSHLYSENTAERARAFRKKYQEWNFLEKIRLPGRALAGKKPITAYPRNGPIWQKAWHWRRILLPTSHRAWLVGPLIAAWVIVIGPRDPNAVSSMSFLYIIMPVWYVLAPLVSWHSEEKFPSIFSGNLLKPVRRGQLYKEVGLAMLIRTWEYTLMIFFYIEIVRLTVFAPHRLASPELWATAIFALVSQLFIFPLCICLYGMHLNRRLAWWLVFGFFFIAFISMGGIHMNFLTLLYISFLALIAGGLLFRLAYGIWYRMEV